MTKKDDAIVKTTTTEIVPDAQNIRMLATDFQKSGMFPQAKSISGIVTIIAYGRELGLGPVASLQAMSVISGKLAIESKVYLALFIRSGGVIEILQKDKKGAKVTFSKQGRKPFTDQYSIEDAKALGFLGKQNWKNYPEEMCYWRCIAKGIRAYDPDVVMGLYTVDEMRDAGKGWKEKNPLTEGELPDALMSESEIEQAEHTTGNDFINGEIVEDDDIPPDNIESPATMDEPPDEREEIAQEIHVWLNANGTDPKAFKLWLFKYQETKGKHYVGKKFNNHSLSEGKLSDLKALRKNLNDAAVKFRDATEKKEESE